MILSLCSHLNARVMIKKLKITLLVSILDNTKIVFIIGFIIAIVMPVIPYGDGHFIHSTSQHHPLQILSLFSIILATGD